MAQNSDLLCFSSPRFSKGVRSEIKVVVHVDGESKRFANVVPQISMSFPLYASNLLQYGEVEKKGKSFL